MRRTKALLFFASGTAVILILTLALVRLMHRRPELAVAAGGGVLAAVAAVWGLRCLPPRLAPRYTAERRIAARLRRSGEVRLLYWDDDGEGAPALLLTGRLVRREGLGAITLSFPAPCAGQLSDLPREADLLLVFSFSSGVPRLNGTAALLPGSEGERLVRFTPYTLQFPGHGPVPIRSGPGAD